MKDRAVTCWRFVHVIKISSAVVRRWSRYGFYHSTLNAHSPAVCISISEKQNNHECIDLPFFKFSAVSLNRMTRRLLQ